MTCQRRRFHLAQDVTISALISTPPPTPPAKPTTLVFLHYWGGSAETWQWVSSHLADEYPIVALDLRGWGASSGPAAADGYSMSLLASDVEAVIQQLDLDHYTLIGLSMGAKVAQVVAAHQPAGLRSVVLLSPASLAPFRLPPAMKTQQVQAYQDVQSAEFVTLNVLTASKPPKEVVDVLVADQMRGSEWARAAWPASGMEEDLSGLWGAIAVPTLVLAAEKDVVETPARVQEEVYKRIRGARWGMIQGSGHLSPVDDAEGVADRIKRFVQ